MSKQITISRPSRDREAPTSRIAGVVKADAYGLGAVPVVRTLLEAGCDMLFVATRSPCWMISTPL